MVNAKNLSTRGASNYLSGSCIILNNMLSFIENLFLTEGMSSVLYIHFHYVFCCRVLVFCVSVPKTVMICMSVECQG